jgi:hypothetical protein
VVINSLLDLGVHVRKMEDADVEVCNELNVKAIDFGREKEIRMAIRGGNAWVLVRDGEIMYVRLITTSNGPHGLSLQ